MSFVKKNISKFILFAIVIVIASFFMTLLPLRSPLHHGTQVLNVVHADISRWVNEIRTNEYDCPLEAVNRVRGYNPGDSNNARTRAFVTAALPIVRAERTMRDRILKAAELALKCRIYFGNCGRSAGALYALAGIGTQAEPAPTEEGDTGCLFSGNGCGDMRIPIKRAGEENELLTLSSRQESLITRGRNCDSPPQARREDCIRGSDSLVLMQVRNELIQSMVRTGRPNYPSHWAELLEPGDWLYIYLGNSTAIGAHSVVFLGWENEAIGSAWVYEGSPSSWAARNAPYAERVAETRVRLNTYCFKTGFTDCAPVYPITKVFALPIEE